MKWELKTDRPIYMQLIEQIEIGIVSGKYQAGEKLPSVRDLAQEAGVNANTMQRALAELERSGLVFAQRTSGRFITEDLAMIEQIKTDLAMQQISAFFDRMQQLGYNTEQTIQILEKLARRGEHE